MKGKAKNEKRRSVECFDTLHMLCILAQEIEKQAFIVDEIVQMIQENQCDGSLLFTLSDNSFSTSFFILLNINGLSIM